MTDLAGTFEVQTTTNGQPAFRAQSSGTINPDPWFARYFSTGLADSGVSVTAESALGQSSIRYGVQKLSGHLATMPLNCYRRIYEGDEVVDIKEARRHPGRFLTLISPSGDPETPRFDRTMNAGAGGEVPEQGRVTPSVFKQAIIANALLDRHGAAWIRRDLNGDPIQLVLLSPTVTWPFRVEGRLWWRTQLSSNTHTNITSFHTHGGDIHIMRDEDVIWVPSLTYNGQSGVSTVLTSANSIGVGIAAESQTNYHYANDTVGRIMLQVPINLYNDQDKMLEFIRQLSNWHQGLRNRGVPGVLPNNIEWKELDNDAAENASIRQFQREENAALMMQETIIGDKDSNSYNSVEAKHRAEYINGVLPLLVKFREQCNLKLLRGREIRGETHYFDFDPSEMLRGDTSSWMDFITKKIAAGLANQDEIRLSMNQSRLPDDQGQTYYISQNVQSIEQANAEPEPPAPAPSTPGAPDEESPDEVVDAVAGVLRRQANAAWTHRKKDSHQFSMWAAGRCRKDTRALFEIVDDRERVVDFMSKWEFQMRESHASSELAGWSKDWQARVAEFANG